MSGSAAADDDGIDTTGKSVEVERSEGGVSIKFVDGKAMVRVYLLDNTFNTLLIPKATTVKVRSAYRCSFWQRLPLHSAKYQQFTGSHCNRAGNADAQCVFLDDGEGSSTRAVFRAP